MEPPPVQYVTTSDGYDIAYTVSGEGQTLVLMPAPFSNVGQAPDNEVGRRLLTRLAAEFRLVCYDLRGSGLSTRGVADGLTVEAYERDLEAVLSQCGEGVVLMAIGLSSHVAIRYAVRRPEGLRALVLWRTGMTAGGPSHFTHDLASSDWDLFLNTYLTAIFEGEEITPGQRHRSVASMRANMDQADYLARMRVAQASILDHDLLRRIHTPTLVLAEDGSLLNPQSEGVKVAASIASARVVMLNRPAGREAMVQPILDFLATLPAQQPGQTPFGPQTLSAREVEVLRLLSAGRSNQQIADELVISLNTVRRHVSNIFDKTGVANRTEASVYARDQGIS